MLPILGWILAVIGIVVMIVGYIVTRPNPNQPYEVLTDSPRRRLFYIPSTDVANMEGMPCHAIVPLHGEFHPDYPDLKVYDIMWYPDGWGYRVTVCYKSFTNEYDWMHEGE